MRRNLSFVIPALFIGFWGTVDGAQPLKIRWAYCDTMQVEVYPPDTLFSGLVRVPIYVKHIECDEGGPPPSVLDSLCGVTIPLCYTHTNPTKYCSVSYDWNNLFLYPFPDPLLERSIFRHFISPETDTVRHNWMMSQSQLLSGVEWDYRVLFLDDTSHFWLSAMRTGLEDQMLSATSRVLLATITFRTEDTMTICIDSCFWPPTGRLSFIRGDAFSQTPRANLPYCFSLTYPMLGDMNADGAVNVGDVVYLLNYLYRGGRPPTPQQVGDVNCDGVVDIGDVVRLIGYLYRGEPPPSC